MQLTKLTFENYKAFKEPQEFRIKSITFVIGKNSSGKSVVSRLPKLLAGALASDAMSPIQTEYDNIYFGENFRDLIHNKMEHGKVSLGATFEDDSNKETVLRAGIQQIAGTPFHFVSNFDLKSEDGLNFELDWEALTDEPPALQLYNIKEGNTTNEMLVEFTGILPEKFTDLGYNNIMPDDLVSLKQEIRNAVRNIRYIGPIRGLPKLRYKYKSSRPSHPGENEESVYHILGLDEYAKGDITEKVGSWYSENLGGWKLDIVRSGDEFEIVLISPDDPAVKVNLTSVGSGMSQVLPFVVRSFMEPEKKGGIEIFEQPELHLHPDAHGSLAELLVHTAKKQQSRFIIETHSENMILRVRRLIVSGVIDSNDVIVYWVDDEERPGSKLKPIHIDEDGELDDWPEGVFSEDYEEMVAIRKAQRRKRGKE